MDTLLLSRVQLGALTAFHLLFPAVTLALGWLLVTFRLRPGVDWARAFGLWMPVYAVSVAFQVVSGWALWTQFVLTLPVFMDQAGAVAHPMQVLYLTGNALQVVPLAIAATGLRVLPTRTVTLLIAASAVGGVITLVPPVILMSWMVDPVGVFTSRWSLTAANWITVLTNPRVWSLALFLILASGLTVGLLMACLSAVRQVGRARDAALDGIAKTGLLLASGSALLGLGLVALSDPFPANATLLVTLTAISLSTSGLLVALRKPDTGITTLPDGLQTLMLVLPIAGWAVLLLGWPFDRMVHSVWLIRGQMRIDDAAAVLAPGAVNATLPVYLATIAVLVLTYFAVLVAMARKSGVTEHARRPVLFNALQRSICPPV
ncbi:cytochrome ubiquinol oxidase subunit I [Phaeobacter marinintestinus]|uniref:cytochrome ubiquinol oxidase subunit I n=1 Tax=Falsiphaeobacter marinintestinus TaxID=1492905 RepID=UPI0011B7CAC5|nr:cytochrome ubiquinol oxidase subunit I [Phaeobacter marinintestinus]